MPKSTKQKQRAYEDALKQAEHYAASKETM